MNTDSQPDTETDTDTDRETNTNTNWSTNRSTAWRNQTDAPQQAALLRPENGTECCHRHRILFAVVVGLLAHSFFGFKAR